MKRYTQFKPFIISEFEVTDWHHPRHNHNHYELIYIKNGKGSHLLNKTKVNYKSGDLFLLGPDDSHEFYIEEKTHFIYIKFTASIFEKELGLFHKSTLKKIDLLINHREIRNSVFRFNTQDRDLISQIIAIISSLANDVYTYEKAIIFQLISIFEIMGRYIEVIPSSSVIQQQKSISQGVEPLLSYIHQNIYYPKKLRAQHLAEEFHTTKNYISKFFKRNMKISLRSYVRQYKLNLIDSRLKTGSYTKKEIASEFGFTDESHLIKTLKKQNEINSQKN